MMCRPGIDSFRSSIKSYVMSESDRACNCCLVNYKAGMKFVNAALGGLCVYGAIE